MARRWDNYSRTASSTSLDWGNYDHTEQEVQERYNAYAILLPDIKAQMDAIEAQCARVLDIIGTAQTTQSIAQIYEACVQLKNASTSNATSSYNYSLASEKYMNLANSAAQAASEASNAAQVYATRAAKSAEAAMAAAGSNSGVQYGLFGTLGALHNQFSYSDYKQSWVVNIKNIGVFDNSINGWDYAVTSNYKNRPFQHLTNAYIKQANWDYCGSIAMVDNNTYAEVLDKFVNAQSDGAVLSNASFYLQRAYLKAKIGLSSYGTYDDVASVYDGSNPPFANEGIEKNSAYRNLHGITPTLDRLEGVYAPIRCTQEAGINRMPDYLTGHAYEASLSVPFSVANTAIHYAEALRSIIDPCWRIHNNTRVIVDNSFDVRILDAPVRSGDALNAIPYYWKHSIGQTANVGNLPMQDKTHPIGTDVNIYSDPTVLDHYSIIRDGTQQAHFTIDTKAYEDISVSHIARIEQYLTSAIFDTPNMRVGDLDNLVFYNSQINYNIDSSLLFDADNNAVPLKQLVLLYNPDIFTDNADSIYITNSKLKYMVTQTTISAGDSRVSLYCDEATVLKYGRRDNGYYILAEITLTAKNITGSNIGVAGLLQPNVGENALKIGDNPDIMFTVSLGHILKMNSAPTAEAYNRTRTIPLEYIVQCSNSQTTYDTLAYIADNTTAAAALFERYLYHMYQTCYPATPLVHRQRTDYADGEKYTITRNKYTSVYVQQAITKYDRGLDVSTTDEVSYYVPEPCGHYQATIVAIGDTTEVGGTTAFDSSSPISFGLNNIRQYVISATLDNVSPPLYTSKTYTLAVQTHGQSVNARYIVACRVHHNSGAKKMYIDGIDPTAHGEISSYGLLKTDTNPAFAHAAGISYVGINAPINRVNPDAANAILHPYSESELEGRVSRAESNITNLTSTTAGLSSGISALSVNKVDKANIYATASECIANPNTTHVPSAKALSEVLAQAQGGDYWAENFGCVADGVTDNTANLQAAVDAVGLVGGTLKFKAGVYRITSRIRIKQPCNILGAGVNATTIRMDNPNVLWEEVWGDLDHGWESNSVISIESSSVNLSNFFLQVEHWNSVTQRWNASNNVYGITMHQFTTTGVDSSALITIKDVHVRGGKSCMFIHGGWNRVIENCYFDYATKDSNGNHGAGIEWAPCPQNGTGGWACSGDIVRSCEMYSCDSAALLMNGCYQTRVETCVCEYNGRMLYARNCMHTRLYTCWNEANTYDSVVYGNIYFEGGYNLTAERVEMYNGAVCFELGDTVEWYKNGERVFLQKGGIIRQGVNIAEETGNLLLNSGFYRDSLAQRLPDTTHWSIYDLNHNAHIWVDTDMTYDDHYYITIDTRNTPAAIVATDEARIIQNVDVSESRYTASAYFMTPNRTYMPNAHIVLGFYNAGNERIGWAEYYYQFVSNNVWEHWIATFDVPEGTHSIGYTIYSGLNHLGVLQIADPNLSLPSVELDAVTFKKTDDGLDVYDVNGTKFGTLPTTQTNSSIEALKARVSKLDTPTQITADMNLNDVTQPGVYYINNVAPTNAPQSATVIGTMRVTGFANMLIQEIIDTKSGAITYYTRTKNSSGVWKNWYRLRGTSIS